MRFLILMLIFGQWTYLWKDQWHSVFDLMFCIGVCISGFSLIHFKYSPSQVWLDFKNRLPYWIFFGLISFGLGLYQVYVISEQRLARVLPIELDGTVQKLLVMVDDIPKVSDQGVQFSAEVLDWQSTLASESFEQNQLPQRIAINWRQVESQWQLKGTHQAKMIFPEVIPGQVWELQLKLKSPRGLKNPHTFDVEQWMFIHQLDANGFVQNHAAKLIKDWRWSGRSVIAKVRFWIKRQVTSSLGKEARYSGVISALVMGDQNAIDQEDWKIFNTTGIGHLISISGLHVTMLAGFGALLANVVWRKTRLPLRVPAQKVAALSGFIVALLYTFLAGFQVPAQRTTMMVGVVGVYLFLYRVPKAFDIWWWALGLVVILDPWAVFTPGFWLSFGAVAAILYAMPSDSEQGVIDSEVLFLQKLKSSLTEACRVQAVVTIALIPLSLWWFYQISLISPFANAIAIPIVSFIVTPMAMLGVVLPWWLGDLCLWIAHFAFLVLAWCLEPMANLSWATMPAAKPSAYLWMLACLGVIVCIRPGKLVRSWKSRCLGLVMCLTLFIPKAWLWGNGLADGELRMFVWDIGQGSAVLIQTKNFHLLYDTGPVSGKFDPGERIILPYLKAEGISPIHQLFISHQDADHVGGLSAILDQYPVINSVGTIPQNHPLHLAYQKNQVPILPCQAGHRWTWDGIELIVWHPSSETTFEKKYHLGKPNEMSCVVEVRNAHHSIWLTGDVEKEAEAQIVQRLQNQPSELRQIHARNVVLMAPHHGSKTSSNPEFVNILRPRYAFSQSGYKNRYRHPHPSVVARYQERGVELKDTAQTGAQVWQTTKDQLRLQYLRESSQTLIAHPH